jgi:glucosyl-dolichyl phosphate glucuronosyltransferase
MVRADTSGGAGAPPLISVVLCTRNRADLLRRALDTLAAQDLDPSSYEIVLVDNASSDHTSQVVQAFPGAATLRHLREDRIGLCVARNTGWRAARGAIVAYFDDDAEACSSWLTAVKDIFSRPDAARVGAVGGPVAPIWQMQRPDWLPDAVAGSLTIVDWGPNEKDILDLDREWLVGANMAVPRRVLEEVGGFHPLLDRIGSNLLSSGDVHLQKQIVRHGYSCVYSPAMAIRHLVPPSRLRKDWFRRRFFWQGVSDATMHLIDCTPSRSGRLGAATSRAIKLLRSRRKLAALCSRTEAADVFALKCFALIDLGYIAGLLGAVRR